MKTKPENGWKSHEEQQRRAWLRLTPAQRLAWLEEAKQFADTAKRARRTTSASQESKPR